MLLERGHMVHLGEPHEVADRYLEINFGRDPEASASTGEERGGDGEARIVEAWVEDEHGERHESLPQGRQITLKALVNFAVDVEDPVAGVYVLHEDHVRDHRRHDRPRARAQRQLQRGRGGAVSFSFENVLAPGRYNPLFTLAHRGTGLDLMDRFEAPSRSWSQVPRRWAGWSTSRST